MNFSWLVLLTIAILLIVYRKKILSVTGKNKAIFLPVLGAFGVFYLFNIFYITYCNPRYLTPYFAFLPVFLALCVSKIEKAYLRKVLYLGFSVLFLIQSFFTIDPIMLTAFKNINVGQNNTIITTRTFVLTNDGLSTEEKYWSNNEMTHAASYNRQYAYLSDLVEKALQDIDYDDKTLIALAPTYGSYMTKLTFFGQRYEDAVCYYNQETGHLTTDDSQMLVNIKTLSEEENLSFLNEYDRVYLFDFPYREKYYNADGLLSHYNILETEDVSVHDWLVHIYKLK